MKITAANSNMNYQRIYDDLIANAKLRQKPTGYVEKHHILPRSMGGTDDIENLVFLTAREHFICHHLLYRIHRTPGMAAAWSYMCSRRHKNRYFNSRAYESSRKALSASKKGVPRPRWIIERAADAKRGVPMSQEQRVKISESLKGRVFSEDHLAKIRTALRGRVLSEEHRKKISENSKKLRHSEETKARISLIGMREILAINVLDGTSLRFPGIKFASNKLGVHTQSVSDALRGVTKSCKGYVWSYADKD